MSRNMQITEIGRLFYIVQSRSRTWVKHFVDLEPGNHPWGNHPYFCTCEAFKFAATRPCEHIKECAIRLLPLIEHFLKWKKSEYAPYAAQHPIDPIEVEEPAKRRYQLKPHLVRTKHEATIPKNQNRLHESVHRHVARSGHR